MTSGLKGLSARIFILDGNCHHISSQRPLISWASRYQARADSLSNLSNRALSCHPCLRSKERYCARTPDMGYPFAPFTKQASAREKATVPGLTCAPRQPKEGEHVACLITTPRIALPRNVIIHKEPFRPSSWMMFVHHTTIHWSPNWCSVGSMNQAAQGELNLLQQSAKSCRTGVCCSGVCQPNKIRQKSRMSLCKCIASVQCHTIEWPAKTLSIQVFNYQVRT